MGVRGLDVPGKGVFEFPRAAVYISRELILDQQPEPCLDQVEPRRTRWSEVDVIGWALRQPTMDQGRLANGGVVQDEVGI